MTNADNILFRCSSLGAIMTEPKEKKELLSVTCKDELTKMYIQHKYGRSKHITSKYLEKGTVQEEESITLYSRFKKDFFQNNKARMTNEYLTGEWDIFKNSKVTDIKTSWDIFSFFKSKSEKIDKKYYFQLHGYAALLKAEKASLVYCLVNTPENLIESEKKSIWWKMGCPNEDSLELQAAYAEIEQNSNFEDIPIKERVIEHEIIIDQAVIQSIYDRIELCRKWMNENLFNQE